MADLATLRSLRERVIASKGADREIDYRLAWAFGQDPWRRRPEEHISMCLPRSRVDRDTLAYTASLDAAVTLVERCLPGWDWQRDCDGFMRVVSPGGEMNSWIEFDCDHESPPIALLAALLAALIARAERGDAA